MAIIDHANFDFGGKKIFAYEYPEKNLSTSTQLNVHPGQEALLVLGGRIEKNQPNGTHKTWRFLYLKEKMSPILYARFKVVHDLMKTYDKYKIVQ